MSNHLFDESTSAMSDYLHKPEDAEFNKYSEQNFNTHQFSESQRNPQRKQFEEVKIERMVVDRTIEMPYYK